MSTFFLQPPPPGGYIKSEARSPGVLVSTAPADSSSSRVGLGLPPGYPSPAITPGSSHSEQVASYFQKKLLHNFLLIKASYPPTSSVSSFWSPITPPEGLGDGGGAGHGGHNAGAPDSAASSASLRQPPALVQMQVPPIAANPHSFHLSMTTLPLIKVSALSLSRENNSAGESRKCLTATPTLPLQLPVRGIALFVAVHERDGATLLVPRDGTATQLQLSLRDDPELLA